MKFNYTKRVGDKEYKAFFDTEVIWHGIIVENETGRVLVLYTTLDPIEDIKQVPHFNKKGEVVEYRATKLLQQPIIEITVPEEIEQYLAL